MMRVEIAELNVYLGYLIESFSRIRIKILQKRN